MSEPLSPDVTFTELPAGDVGTLVAPTRSWARYTLAAIVVLVLIGGLITFLLLGRTPLPQTTLTTTMTTTRSQTGARTPKGLMVAHIMTDFAKSMGAVCLDGSPGAFFFAPAADVTNANNWQIFFAWGGWCWEERDCWHRAHTNLGSSNSYKDKVSTYLMDGMFSADCIMNPDFCNYNRVFVTYCDGTSYSGNREAPVIINGRPTPIYFRGRRIMDAVFLSLLRDHNLALAENVLLTGESAGGLSIFLHADYIGELLKKHAPNLKRYKAAPASGFFLSHDTVEKKPVFVEQMRYLINLSNSSWPGSMNAACLQSKIEADRWKCMFAAETWSHVKTPLFVINSDLDDWQIECIYTAELEYRNSETNGNCSAVPGWQACIKSLHMCTEAQTQELRKYQKDFRTEIRSKAAFHKPGNGVFIYSMYGHMLEMYGFGLKHIHVGNVSLQKALSKWWHQPQSSRAADHNYISDLTLP